jgi:NTP pyrophosphatase (non-canonical NTP hydrolase)
MKDADNISFEELRLANAARVVEFRNAQGEIAHPHGVDNWTIAEWTNALAGEAGEACNLSKKIRRGDFMGTRLLGAYQDLVDEIADVVVYADLCLQKISSLSSLNSQGTELITLGAAVRQKFNLKSEEIGSSVRL